MLKPHLHRVTASKARGVASDGEQLAPSPGTFSLAYDMAIEEEASAGSFCLAGILNGQLQNHGATYDLVNLLRGRTVVSENLSESRNCIRFCLSVAGCAISGAAECLRGGTNRPRE